MSLAALFFLFNLGLSKLLPPPINGTISVDGWRLDHFNKELFWEEPPEGMSRRGSLIRL
jgi:hypothetical protein